MDAATSWINASFLNLANISSSTTGPILNETEVSPGIGNPRDFLSASLQKKLERLQIAIDIHKYSIPVIATLGIIGNLFSLLLMQRALMKKTSTRAYVSTLAVADSFVLVQHMATHWVYFHSSEPYLLKSDLVCKLGEWAFMFGGNWAAWVVVSLTTERFIVTTFPLHARQWCTRKSALIALSLLTLVIAVFWLTLVFVWGVDTDGPCNQLSEYYDFAKRYGYWIAVTTYTLLPTPILIVLNVILVRRLTRAMDLRRQMTGSTQRSGATHTGSNSSRPYDKDRPQRQTVSRVTTTAVAVSVTYLVLTLPASLFNVLNVSGTMDMEDPDILFAHFVLLVVRTSNHSVNFVIYILTSTKMRSEFVSMVTSATHVCRRPLRRAGSFMVRSVDGSTSRGTEMSMADQRQGSIFSLATSTSLGDNSQANM